MKAYEWAFVIIWLVAAVHQVSGDTEILLKEPSGKGLWAWHAKKFIDQGAGWNAPSTQKPAYGVCDISTTREPLNWLRTDFIAVKDAKLLNIELHYSLLNCPGKDAGDYCKTYFTIYVLRVDAKTTPAPEPYTVPYEEVDTITPKNLSKPDEVVFDTYHGKVATKKARGVYLAFKDQGSCFSITKVIVSYNYCSEMNSVLLKFNRTVAPVNDSHLVEQEGKCTDPKSVNKVKLSGVCLSSGKWNVTDGIECLCKPGYELVNGSDGKSLECRECPKGSYKSVVSNNKCLQCPANSAANIERTGCSCNDGFYMLTDISPCEALPSAPRNVSAAFVNDTAVEITWLPPILTDQIHVFYDVSCSKICGNNDDKCLDTNCGDHINFIPTDKGLNTTQVTVRNLLSLQGYMFKIYSKNRVSEVAQREHGVQGNFSTLTIKTLESAPGDLEVYLKILNDTSIRVSWKMERTNSIIQAYYVTYTRVDNPEDTKTIKTTKTTVIVTGLKPGHTYSFLVVAENRSGRRASPAILARTTNKNGDSGSDSSSGRGIGSGSGSSSSSSSSSNSSCSSSHVVIVVLILLFLL